MKENLAKVVSDRSRRVKVYGKHAIVPLKFDEDGNPSTQDKLICRRLSLNDLRFLKALREDAWDIAKASAHAGINQETAERLVKKLACFREEDARVKALCEIPTRDWISAKHVQNVYEGGTLQDSEHKSLAELAKIEGAYKNNLNISVTQNVFNLPKYDAATEAKLKKIADQEAMLIQEATIIPQAANG